MGHETYYVNAKDSVGNDRVLRIQVHSSAIEEVEELTAQEAQDKIDAEKWPEKFKREHEEKAKQ